MRVAITGSSGLIGSALTQYLRQRGHDVLRLVRRTPIHADERFIDPERQVIGDLGLSDVDAVVNLAGTGIADRRWTLSRMAQIRSSRVDTTLTVAEAVRRARAEGHDLVWLNGSAVGYYGDCGDQVLDETASRGAGFLAGVCDAWESAALLDDPELQPRTGLLRTGHVLAPNGGLLGKQKLLYELGLGGPIGRGAQYVSWITLRDYVRATEFLLTNPVSGPVNMTGPAPVPQREFAHAIGQVLHRPTVMPMPLPLVKAVFSAEMVNDAMLASQRAVPAALLEAGFEHQARTVDEGLEQVLG